MDPPPVRRDAGVSHTTSPSTRSDLIDTTGLGPYREWAARVALEAGLQPIRLRCRYGGGRSTPSLSVKYEGPGVAKQTAPASALFHATG